VSGFTGSPRVAKGAIVGFDPANPLASVIVFQYNPDAVTRRLTPNTAPSGRNPGEQQRLKGPPGESITMAVELDAADQLERGDDTAVQHGIEPSLASLELLLFPKTALVLLNAGLALAGVLEVVPPQVPLTILVWGDRVVPVRITDLSITEEAFDPALHPIRAKIDLGLQVLTYDDLGVMSFGGLLSIANQQYRERQATINGAGNVGSFVTAITQPRGG
jgi:hypothetical protein